MFQFARYIDAYRIELCVCHVYLYASDNVYTFTRDV